MMVHPRSCCQVFVYIAPWKCSSWAMKSYIVKTRDFIPEGSTKIFTTISENNTLAPYIIHGSRSQSFFIIVGKHEMTSLFTFRDVDQTLMNYPTKLFIWVESTGPGRILGLYLALPPLKTEEYLEEVEDCPTNFIFGIVCRLLPILRRVYVYTTLNPEILTIDFLEREAYLHYKRDMRIWSFFSTSRESYKSLEKYYKNTAGQYVREWRGIPAMEIVILQIIFPNTTIFQGRVDTTNYVTNMSSKLIKTVAFGPHHTAPYEVKTGHYFVTCADITEMGGLSLIGYASAYDLTTWIFIGLSAVISSATMAKVREGGLSNYIIIPFTIMLEQGGFDGSNLSRKFHCVLGAWLLVGIVLSNAYKGDNITSLTAPLSQSKLETFDQLISENFSYFSSAAAIKTAFLVDDITQATGPINNLVKLLVGNHTNLTILDDAYDWLKAGEQFPKYWIDQYQNTSIATRRKAQVISEGLMLPKSYNEMQNFTKSKYFLPFLSSCKKEAYVSEYTEVLRMSNQLISQLSKTRRKPTVSMSVEPLEPAGITWKFKSVPIPAGLFSIRINSLWQSGLAELWTAWDFRIVTRKGKTEVAYVLDQAKLPKKLTLSDNIVVVFYLYVIFAILALFSFLYELIRKIALCPSQKLESKTFKFRIFSSQK